MVKSQLSTVKPDAGFWKKKALVSFLMSVLILLIHIYSFFNYTDTGSTISAINSVLSLTFREGFTRHAVPLYFILSGALFFRDYSSDRYVSKMKNRVKTLLVPYLMWNTIWMLFNIAISYSFISNYFIGREKFMISVPNVLAAIFHHKCHGHFWFVFDIIVFSLAAPIIDLLTRTRRTAILSIVAVEVLNLMGYGLPASIFHADTSILYYLIGAMIGKYYLPHFMRRSTTKERVISVIILVGYAVQNVFFPNEAKTELQSLLLVVQYLLCAWAFWNVCDWVPDDSFIHRFTGMGFAVYATHGNIASVTTKLLYLAMPKNEYFAFPNYVLTAVLTLFFVWVFWSFTKKRMPKLHGMLMGSR